jgi:threonine dehydrogenase-like Zn-dependent dehydrogenase
VRALVADLSLPRAAWTAIGSRFRPDVAWRRGGVLSMTDIPQPALPSSSGWVRIRPTYAGVCGSDLKLLHVTGFSPVLSAYSPAERAVLGHEVTGVVEAVGRGVTRFTEGQRVLVEPTLRCLHKGLPECRRCRAGEGHLCENLDRAGSLCPGQGIGFSDVVGGGWSEGVLAHESMLVDADSLDPRRAVLAEPASVGLHAALRWQRAGDRAVVIGPGTIGLLVTAALRRLHPDLDIVMVCAGEFGAARALEAGASCTVQQPPVAALAAIAEHVGARQIRPRFGKLPVLDGGVDVVFDCVANAATIDLGLRLLRGRGTFVMVGTAARETIDWSLVWWRELTIRGAVVYGEENDPTLGTAGRRTIDIVGEWLSDSAYAVGGVVTHTFPLQDYADALATATAGPAAGAVKVVFRLP